MLAYQHAYHAGNHGDVLKHLVLVAVLQHMNAKDKGYRLVDTHAGAGAYALDAPAAQKKGEYLQGIARLWQRGDAPGEAAAYLDCVRRFNEEAGESGALSRYPGSPAIARMLLRAQDQLRLFELHPAEHDALQAWLGRPAGVLLEQRDGFAALKSQLPPPTRRGVVLIDPSYEGHGDYARVRQALADALQRFAEGVYLLWYPQVAKAESAQLPGQLKALAPKGWLHVRLSPQQPDAQGFGLAGSGMFVINPPHRLHAQLRTVLPWLSAALAQHPQSGFLLEQHSV